jgi:glycosyltransferase involved in cell wall biosynthesis
VRILTLSYEYSPVGGGGSAVAGGLARRLAAKGHQVDVVTMGFGKLPAVEESGGVRIYRLECGRASKSKCPPTTAARYVLRARPLVRELLDRNAYDLLHAHFIFPDGIIAEREARRAGIPYVITAHGTDVPGYNSKAFFKAAHVVLRPLWRRVVRASRRSPSTLPGGP